MTAVATSANDNDNKLDMFGLNATEPVKVRVKRAPKHDFKDGRGRVFAHRHDNGGGWVENTAYVAPSVKVSSSSQVAEFARIYDNVNLAGKVTVKGRARIMNNVVITGRITVAGNAVLRDHVEANGAGFVGGSALIDGTSRLLQAFHITDFVTVRHSVVHGHKNFMPARIFGNALVQRSRIEGACSIFDSAIVDESNLYDVVVGSAARILRSQRVSTIVDWRIRSLLTRRRSREEDQKFFEEATNGVDWRTVIHGILLNSIFETAPTHVPNGTYILGSQIQISGFPGTSNLNFPDRPIIGANIRSFFDFTNAMEAAAPPVRGQGGAPVIQAIGAVPAADAPRQRRIMRLNDQ